MKITGVMETRVEITLSMSVQEANDFLFTVRQYFGGAGYRGDKEARTIYEGIKAALGDYMEKIQ